ncbi:FlaD/FlaE family flagellar protein [Haloferax sp. DFSO52]|uniref:FlaD/FlaE family flagellar protein n=1 Tax=Haloferax sp. DFSO52 TaxID=3388505 RepID=UPI003A87FB8E
MPVAPEHHEQSRVHHAVDSGSDESFEWVDEPVNQSWRKTAYERLIVTTAMVTSDGDAYLESVPRTPGSEQILLKWCVHLVERLGGRGALLMVSYYRDIGWIGDDLHDAVHERIVSFSAPSEFEEIPTEEDHLRSFSYIAQLASLAEDD